MSTEKFRRQLREASREWCREGFVDAKFYEALAKRYAFDELEDSGRDRFKTLLLSLGGILLGLGAITFVAANWQEWSRWFRVGLLLFVFLTVNTTGCALWQAQQSRWHRLGHGLLLMGALLMGANLGLMSQMFHQSGSPYTLFGIWGLGVLAMAYGLQLSSLGIISLLLMFLGFCNYGFGLQTTANPGVIGYILSWFPLLMFGLYLPLAHALRSRVLFAFWSFICSIVFSITQVPSSYWSFESPWTSALTLTLPAALFWTYRSDLWTLPSATKSEKQDPFQSWGKSLSILITGFTLYSLSFRFWWQDFPFPPFSQDQRNPLGLIIAIAYLLIAVFAWWKCLRQQTVILSVQSPWLKAPVFLSILITTYGLSVVILSQAELSIIGPIALNILLVLFSFILLHDGLVLGGRRRFWSGMVLLVLGITSRMFEYNTALILKAIVLAGCGLAVICAGLWFESQSHPPKLPTHQP